MTRQEARERAKALVSQMTVEEKASQLKYDSPAIPRLNIPYYNWWNEALHGVARAGTATSFPQAIGLAATFDHELLEQIGDAVAEEGRAKYNAYSEHGDRDIYKGLTFWSPNVNIFRDPRWGRGHETYGEDPYLTGKLAVSFIKGIQGEGEFLKAAACGKHYVVHSGPEGIRHEFDAQVSKKDFRETYLPAFEDCVQSAQVEGIMGAYNRVNGEVCCGSKYLIQELLRDELGFEGYYVSDCWAIQDFHLHHMVTSTPQESARMALEAGCDVNCGTTYLHIMKAYQDGLVTEEQITRSVERLFTTRHLLGLFDDTIFNDIPYEKVECKKHLTLAEDAARKSLVLLKNDGILPLDTSNLKTIGVIGPNANSREALIGNYYGTSSEYITVLEGIQREVGDEVRIMYSQGCHLYKDKVEGLAWNQDRISEAVIVAEHSDVVVLCLGLDATLEGEEGDTGNSYASGDKNDLSLPAVQIELLEAVAKVGKPVVLCLLAGSAIDLNFAHENINGILLGWYPGARGGKVIAECLFGKISPSGKLPITFYRDLEGFPEFTDYRMKGRTYRYLEKDPLYPFGYGLTYGDVNITKIELKGLSKEEKQYVVGEDIPLVLNITVKNNSELATEDVIQVYVKDLESAHAVRNVSLCGVERVALQGLEEKQITISINQKAFTIVDTEGKRYRESNEFCLSVGLNQPDERSEQLTGKKSMELLLRFR